MSPITWFLSFAEGLSGSVGCACVFQGFFCLAAACVNTKHKEQTSLGDGLFSARAGRYLCPVSLFFIYLINFAFVMIRFWVGESERSLLSL